MSSSEWKNPTYYRRCQGKRCYRSMEQAEIEAERSSMSTGELIIAYECYDCGNIHIGHADLSQQIAFQQLAQQAFSNTAYVGKPCQHCGKAILEAKMQNGKRFETPALYCSNRCHKLAARSRREARLAEDFQEQCCTADNKATGP
jgi:hypothetical protein